MGTNWSTVETVAEMITQRAGNLGIRLEGPENFQRKARFQRIYLATEQHAQCTTFNYTTKFYAGDDSLHNAGDDPLHNAGDDLLHNALYQMTELNTLLFFIFIFLWFVVLLRPCLPV